MERPASPLSRRNILIGLSGAAVCAAVAIPKLRREAGRSIGESLASSPTRHGFVSLAEAEQSEWTAQVGTVFAAEGGYRLRLAGVRPLASTGTRPAEVTRASAFVAVFDLLDGLTMAGDLIYTVAHPEYGALPIFLTAAGDSGRMLAVFN